MIGWGALLAEARESYALAATAFVLTLVLVLRLVAPKEDASRARLALLFLFLFIVLLPVTASLRGSGSPAYLHVRLAAHVMALMALVLGLVSVVFAVVLPRLQMRVPVILREVLVGIIAVVGFFVLAHGAGYNLSGLIATSTVLTAIIGLSFQDTLGNVMAGLALQVDQSVAVGDWIKLGDLVGKVTQIRWRYVAVETRNWETAVIPNSVLVKNQFLVLGKREGQPVELRRWIWFTVDYRVSPPEVINTVVEALRAAPIPGMAAEPQPTCMLMDLADSYGKYALRYWLTDLPNDDPTDTLVRTRIYFALRRASIPLSMPAHAVFLTEESTQRKAQKSDEETVRRVQALRKVDLFEHLSDESRLHLAESLHYAPFAAGEVMTRQGAEAHWLYIVIQGKASVRVTEGGITTEVSVLGPGEFFGEMGLLTGAPRSATVVALTDAACYRLEKAAFQEIIRRRPELAERVAEVLASRRWRLQNLVKDLDAAARSREMAAVKRDLVTRIRRFFGISS